MRPDIAKAIKCQNWLPMKSHKQVQAAAKFTHAEIGAVLLGPDHLADIAMHRPSI